MRREGGGVDSAMRVIVQRKTRFRSVRDVALRKLAKYAS